MATIEEIVRAIEERAVQAFPHNKNQRYAYSKGATEQDRIARKEEQERCIKAAICVIKEVLQDYAFDWCRTVAERNKKIDELIDESFVEYIRKAIEEGGSHG